MSAPAPRGPAAIVEGILDLKGRIGFVLSEDPKQTDVLVQGPSLELAMDGDRVRTAVQRIDRGGRRQGEIIAVIARARKTLTGIVRMEGGRTYIEAEADRRVLISDQNGLQPAAGQLAVARITEWPNRKTGAKGSLVEILGDPNSAKTDFSRVMHSHEIPIDFDPKTQSEAAAFGTTVPESAVGGRHTFFDQTVFTIDGADAKDFDDAVHIEILPGGARRLGVHIADVSHYVREGTDLDRTARERGTSVYFPGRVVPMLPFALSDNLCSLRPNETRLTLSCVMDIDSSGRVTGHRLYESVIRSAKRFTYDDVESILKGQSPADLEDKIISDVREMGRLALLLRKRRMERGSLDFDFPEPEVTADPHGRVIDIQKKERLESHRLVEDFMLLANETVARHMSRYPFLYRIHERPDPSKLESLKKTLASVGLPVAKETDLATPKRLQKVLVDIAGRPTQTLVNLLVLRSLKQAVYSASNGGHFGLASTCYTHFTSPIRRYPDLIVHRLVREHLQNRLSDDRQKMWREELPRLGEATSRLERRAVQAERDYMAVQKVRLMESKIGEEHDGVISSVTSFGLFVELGSYFVEGLVRLSDLDDYFVFDEVRLVLRGKRTGRVYAIGQPVRVRVVGANPAKGQLDFDLIHQKNTARKQGRSRVQHR